jgi:outer membrane protein assembly factor BamB
VEGQYAFSPDERDGVLYVGTYDRDGGGSALLLDADDGTQTHKLSATGQQWSSVEPGPNGTLLLLEGNFAGSGEAFVLALDAETGAERWRIEPDLDQIGGAVAWNDLLILSGGTFRGDQDQATAIAIDIATGEERWRFTPGLDDLYTPVIADDALYFGSFNSDGGAALIALDASSGDELWRFAPAGMWDVATPAIAGDLAVFGAFSYDIDNGGLLIAVELETGTADWQVDSGLDAVYTPAVAGDMVYAGTFSSSGNAALLAIDAATGVEQWRFVPDGNHGGLFSGDPGQDYVGSPAIADNILYVGVGTWDADGDGSLYALEHDGSVRWEFTPNPAVDLVYSPTLADGIAYAGTSDENGAALIAISGS